MTKKKLYQHELRYEDWHKPRYLGGYRARISGLVFTLIVYRAYSGSKHLMNNRWKRLRQVRYALAVGDQVLMSGIAKSSWRTVKE